MVSIQSFRSVPFRGAYSLLLACVAAATLSACSNGAEEAAEAAAVAEFHLGNGNLPEARLAINQAIQAKDDLIDLHLLRGRIEFAAGDRAAAFDAYYNALALDPLNNEALQAVSQIGITTGNIAEAEDATDRILAISPAQPDALLVKGLIALARRREAEAIRYADRALTAQPGNENARILKARALYLDGNSSAALATIGGGESGGAGPVSEGIALTRLEIFRQIGDAANMDREFVRLRNLRPADSGLRIDEANFRLKRGDAAAANGLLVRALTQTAEVNAEQGLAARDVARQAVDLWQQHGDGGMTNADWAGIAGNAPVEAREVVARHLLNTRNLDQAEQTIAALTGPNRQALAARLQAARGDARGAVASAAAVLAQDETHCDALVATSEAQLALRRPDAAVRAGQCAAAECPNRPEAFIAAALAYDAFGRQAGAERVFSEAINANPQDIALVEAYARWLLDKRQGRQAVAILRRYTRDTPASVRGWRLYADFCRRTGASCAREADLNRERAASIYAIDLAPGQLQPNGLFGRLIER